MAVKKITYDGAVLIDLTTDTASAADVRSGKTFHANDGTVQTGTFVATTDQTQNFIMREYPFAGTINFFSACTTIGSGAFCCYRESTKYLCFDNCTTIGSYAFYNASFSGLSFPQVSSVGEYAFAYYKHNNIWLPGITTIPANGFYGYSGAYISKAMFPNVTIVASSAFRYAAVASEISIAGITSAYQYAFANMTTLMTVNLPSLSGTAGVNLFYGDSALASVSLPNLRACAGGTFYQCYALTSINLPKVSYVSNTTFGYCSYLTAAYFPSLAKISSTYAFRNCLRLVSLYLLSTAMVTLTNANAFTSTPISTYSTIAGHYGTIYVRASLLATYQANATWKAFSARMVGLTDAQIAALPI